MSATQLKVLISGAGIAGPCLAYWLTKTGLNLSIKVIERSPLPRVTGQAIDIRGPAIDIIKNMKLEEAVRARNTTEEGTVIINSKGKTISRFQTGDVFTAEYEILRADLCELFLDATKDLENVEYVYGDRIQSLQQSDKQVDISFNKGSNETFDLVVAADGSTSPTRRMILDDDILRDSYKFWGQYVAYFSIPSRPTDPKLWQWYSAPTGLGVMLRPHRNPSTLGAYLCITKPTRETRDPAIEEALESGTEASKKILRKYFEKEGWETPRILDGMDQAEDFYMSRTAQVKLPRWTNNRSLVLGDAANATMGIGTSLAIAGGYILAGELSKIKGSEDIPTALKRYEEVFRRTFAASQEAPSGFPQLAFPQTSWGLGIRNSILWFVGKTKLYSFFPEDGGMASKVPDYDWKDL